MVKEFKEKTITVGFTKAFEKPVTKRAKSALHILKNTIRKETRATQIKLTNKVNEALWERGLFKTIRKITVKVVNEKDGVRVYLPDEKIIVKKEKKEAPKNKQEEIKQKVEKLKGKKEEKKETNEKKEEKKEISSEKETSTKKTTK